MRALSDHENRVVRSRTRGGLMPSSQVGGKTDTLVGVVRDQKLEVSFTTLDCLRSPKHDQNRSWLETDVGPGKMGFGVETLAAACGDEGGQS